MIVKRYEHNPILEPDSSQAWEAHAVFNGCPIIKDGKTYLFYRAVSLPHYHTNTRSNFMVSDIGIAESENGYDYTNRRKYISPEQEWEKYGCEDPRVTKLDDKYYITYTALGSWPPNANTIKVGVAVSNDLAHIESKHLVTPFNAKAMSLFPEKINGKVWAILSVDTDNPPSHISLAELDRVEDLWSESYWNAWYIKKDEHVLQLKYGQKDHVEAGAPPIKTEHGWLVFYSHIRNYFTPNPVFGVDAVLLDLNDPRKIIGQTDVPLLVPDEYYEKYGTVPNVVFPTGALLKDPHTVTLFYGSADTTCSVADIDLPLLIDKFIKKQISFTKLKRFEGNPIISPIKENGWEAQCTFNPGAIVLNGKVHIVYRAMSDDNTSVFGYATNADGMHIDYRAAAPIYTPRTSFEQKLVPGGNSGVEDPRLTQIGDKIYILYTAFDGKNLWRIAMSHIRVDDFVAQNWNWSDPVIISSPDTDDKDAALFPDTFNGKYCIVHRSGDDADLSFIESLDFNGNSWLEEVRWLRPRKGWWDSRRVGIASPPIKTDEGWLVLYHGISDEDGGYRVGAILADLTDPTRIISRTDYPIFEAEEPYEKEGIVPNVVFPCGAVVLGEDLFVYYGGADKVVGVASVNMKELMNVLQMCKLE